MQCAATTGAKRTQRERNTSRRHACMTGTCPGRREPSACQQALTEDPERSERPSRPRPGRPARPGSRESAHAP
eukprot:346973-Prymnesium_polylepis.1